MLNLDGIEKDITLDINLLIDNMRGTITIKDLFLGMNTKKVHGEGRLKSIYLTRNNLELSCRVAGVFLDLMITDILSGNGRFSLTAGNTSFIEMFKLSKDLFIKNKKKSNKTLKDQDPFKSNFCGYIPRIIVNRRGFNKGYPIRINNKLKKILSDTVNSGCRFNNYTIKTYKDYIDLVHSHFDKLHKESISYILRFICNKIYVMTFNGHEVQYSYKPVGLSFFIKGNTKKDYNLIERMLKRIRYLSKFNIYKFDGYYYFSLTEERHKKFQIDTKPSACKVFRYIEGAMANCDLGYIYKVKLEEEENNFNYLKYYEKSNVEYVSRRNKLRSKRHLSTEQYTNRLS